MRQSIFVSVPIVGRSCRRQRRKGEQPFKWSPLFRDFSSICCPCATRIKTHTRQRRTIRRRRKTLQEGHFLGGRRPACSIVNERKKLSNAFGAPLLLLLLLLLERQQRLQADGHISSSASKLERNNQQVAIQVGRHILSLWRSSPARPRRQMIIIIISFPSFGAQVSFQLFELFPFSGFAELAKLPTATQLSGGEHNEQRKGRGEEVGEKECVCVCVK